MIASRKERRVPKRADAALVVFWNPRENDFTICYPRSSDGHYAHTVFCSERIAWRPVEGVVFDPPFVKELERRGYDLKTLRFSIERKPARATT